MKRKINASKTHSLYFYSDKSNTFGRGKQNITKSSLKFRLIHWALVSLRHFINPAMNFSWVYLIKKSLRWRNKHVKGELHPKTSKSKINLIVWETNKWHYAFNRPNRSCVIDHNTILNVLIIISRFSGPLSRLFLVRYFFQHGYIIYQKLFKI